MSELLATPDDISRHRCGTPTRPLTDRRIRLGRRHTCCTCCRVYRLEDGPFGRHWAVISAPVEIDLAGLRRKMPTV